ncbi:MAG: hypothetical protein KGM42_07920 [Hyphomicrobiales bacterium]|nr:hypothetical protein [Hyphomicrobiales bacterium]
MFLETLGLAVSLVAALAPWRALPPPPAFAPAFRPAERAVDNWRRESARNLDVAPQDALALVIGRDIKGVSRCVRLNNYWCVKKAGWTGELASDAEGHVAFASAADGAAVAAGLLRRYYLDFRLHSARAIVERWAPAQCGPVYAAPAAGARRGVAGMGGRTLLGPDPTGLTTRGLRNTLRAKWLAAHGGGGARGGRPRRSRAPDYAGPSMRTPTIEAGIGAVETAGPPVRVAMLPFPGMALGPRPGLSPSAGPPPLPARSCASETQRIASYAAHIADGLAVGPDADLALFDADGRPTPNFAKALANMAAVEIGPLRAREELIVRAVAGMLARAARP